jgi:hypothetical protein
MTSRQRGFAQAKQTLSAAHWSNSMTDLSPAAQAIWEAFNEDEAGVFVDYGDKLAAALKAAADQVVPEEPEPDQAAMSFSDWNLKTEGWDARKNIRAELLAIAAELENNQ